MNNTLKDININCDGGQFSGEVYVTCNSEIQPTLKFPLILVIIDREYGEACEEIIMIKKKLKSKIKICCMTAPRL